MVECLVANEKVAGSSPVSRFFGAVPKWLREQSAKLLFAGSNPARTCEKQRIRESVYTTED